MTEIRDITGKLLFTAPLTEGCIYRHDLMKEEYIQLSFRYHEPMNWPAGAWIEYDGRRFSLLDPYMPTRNSEDEYTYEPRFESEVMSWKKQPFFFFTTDEEGEVNSAMETEWSGTMRPGEFLDLVLRNLMYFTGKQYVALVDTGLTEIRHLQFQSASIFEALSRIADTWETEWWVEGREIHLSRCYRDLHTDAQSGEPVSLPLQVGRNIQVPTVNTDKEGYYNRFYAFGSTRNLVPDDTSQEGTVAHLVHNRLRLPEEKYPYGYKDMVEEGNQLHPGEIFIKTLVFDHIYPKSELTVGEVYSTFVEVTDDEGNRIVVGEKNGEPLYKVQEIFYVQLRTPSGEEGKQGEVFTEAPQLIAGKDLCMYFEGGALSGWEFEAQYFERTQIRVGQQQTETVLAHVYRINYDNSSGILVPNSLMAPERGDPLILLNVELPQAYVTAAQLRLEEALSQEIEHRQGDRNTYEFDSNPVAFYQEQTDLQVGQKVLYIDGDHRLETRVLSVEKKLDEVCRQHATIGEERIIGSTQALREEVAEITENVELLRAISDMHSSIVKSYSSTQDKIRDGLEAIGRMWELDKGNPIKDESEWIVRSRYNVVSEKAIVAQMIGRDLETGSGSGGGGASCLYELLDVADSVEHAPAGSLLYKPADNGKWETIGRDHLLKGYVTDTELSSKGYLTASSMIALERVSGLSAELGKKADKTIGILAGTGLTGGGTLSQNRTLSLSASGVTAGTYPKVTVDTYGRVTAGAPLTAADIPALAISKITHLESTLKSKMEQADFDELFEKVNLGTSSAPVWAIRAKMGLYLDSFLTAGKVNEAPSGSDGYDLLDSWSSYDESKQRYVLSAGLGYDLYGRVLSLEDKAITVQESGSGNAYTSYEYKDNTLTLVRGANYLTPDALSDYATRDWVSDRGYLTSASLSGYATQKWVEDRGYLTTTGASSVYLAKAGGTLTGPLVINNTTGSAVARLNINGYGGASWDNGAGALSVSIADNSAQTPLLVAYRAGSAVNVTGANRLLALELLNSGTTFRVSMGGAQAFTFYRTSDGKQQVFYIGEKTSSTDGKTGLSLVGNTGRVHLTGTAGSWPGFEFYQSGATARDTYLLARNGGMYTPKFAINTTPSDGVSETYSLKVGGTSYFSGAIYGTSSIYSSGKTSTADGITGVALYGGNLYLTHSSGSVIYFYQHNSTSSTAYIRASSTETGTIRVNSRLAVNNETAGAYAFYVNGTTYLSGVATLAGGVTVGSLLTANGNIKTKEYIEIGALRLTYDSANNALYVSTASGGAANFYALGGISALGEAVVSGGNTDVLSALKDVSLTGTKIGDIIQYNGTHWVNVSSDTLGLNQSQLASYLSTNNYATHTWIGQQNYLTTTAASNIYLSKAGGTLSGSLYFGSASRYISSAGMACLQGVRIENNVSYGALTSSGNSLNLMYLSSGNNMVLGEGLYNNATGSTYLRGGSAIYIQPKGNTPVYIGPNSRIRHQQFAGNTGSYMRRVLILHPIPTSDVASGFNHSAVQGTFYLHRDNGGTVSAMFDVNSSAGYSQSWGATPSLTVQGSESMYELTGSWHYFKFVTFYYGGVYYRGIEIRGAQVISSIEFLGRTYQVDSNFGKMVQYYNTNTETIQNTEIYNSIAVMNNTRGLYSPGITTTETIVPTSGNKFNLGSSTYRFNNAYLGALYVGTSKSGAADGYAGVSIAGAGGVEISGATPYIDFHHGNSTKDYTSRIIEYGDGVLNLVAPAGVVITNSSHLSVIPNDSRLYVVGKIGATTHIIATQSLGAGGKTAATDGVAGAYINSSGNIHITGSGTSNGVYWYVNKSASATHSLLGIAAGLYTVSSVGIGASANSSYKLYVNGNSYLQGAVTVTGTSTCSGNASFNGLVYGNGKIYARGGTTTTTAAATVGPIYTYAALEIREANQSASASTNVLDAPALAFHWSGRFAACLSLTAAGVFSFINQTGNGYSSIRAAGGTFASNVSVGTTLAVTGNSTLTGTLTVNNTSLLRAVSPQTNNSYSLGTTALRWSNICTTLLNVSSAATLTGAVTMGSNATVAGILGVTGTSTFGGTIKLNSATLNRTGYGGASWNNGYPALAVEIYNNDSQTPLLMAYRSGSTVSATGDNRLFSMEYLNSGTQLRFSFKGTPRHVFSNTGTFSVNASNTSYNLYVNGTTYLSGATTVNGTLTATGAINNQTSTSGYIRGYEIMSGLNKTAYNDGKAGATLGQSGNIHLVVNGSPYVYFYRSLATTSTSYMAQTTVNGLRANPRLGVGIDAHATYTLNTASFICQSWVRTVGNTGWYNETYGGGIQMTDTVWVRVYGSKQFYISNTTNATARNAAASFQTEGGIACGKDLWAANVFSAGAVTAQTTSDRNAKYDFREFDACQVLLTLGMIMRFRYKDTHKEAMGPVYQDVVRVLPQMDARQKGDKYGSLNYLHPDYINLVAAATQQTIQKVETIRERVDRLEKENSELKQKVEQLTNSILCQ